MKEERIPQLVQPAAQAELEELYAESAIALDDGDYQRWASFFAESCSYSITTKENVDHGWPISLMSCETRGMLIDRIFAVQKTLFYAPRVQRRLQGSIRPTKREGALTHCRASFAVFETLTGEPTTLYAVGRYLDVIGREEGALKLVARTCVLDSSLIPNSLPFPL